MDKSELNVSDEAVRNATGRTWDAWKDTLDTQGGRDRSHEEIVAIVRENGGVESGWWQQMVTNGYEKLIGRRTTGETQDTGFQIGVQKTVGVPHDRVWQTVTSPEGVAAWLGEDADVVWEEGRDYALPDGSTGEVRVVRPGSHLRITWHPQGWPRASTIQVRTIEKGPGKTTISFHQEHLPDEEAREARRAHFKEALKRLREFPTD